ncbi:MAG: RNA polymerase sigma-70 factor [Bacteroides sp.]|nr:RNA polymerase sigma-70 factor [Bacteroides sp.]
MPETDNSLSMKNFSVFFQENRERFLTFTYSYVRDQADAEDILMDSMVALWENRNRWDHHANLHTIFLTIIKNKALNYLAHQQVKIHAAQEITSHQQRELNLRIATLEACDPDLIFDRDIQELLQQALNKLPKQSREIFLLSRFHHLTNKEIAQQLGLSVKSVEFHMTRSLKILRLELKDYLMSILF